MEKILVVEDDEDVRLSIRRILENENHNVTEAKNGMEGLEKFDECVHLVILDIMMPGIDGIETCRRIREISNVPVLFLTARKEDVDKMEGFNAGGDDYLVKPFAYVDFITHVRALLRRYVYYNDKDLKYTGELIEYKELKLELETRRVFLGERELRLTDKEYGILVFLLENKGGIFSSQKIYENVWGNSFDFSARNTLMVHIRRLRQKLNDDPENPEYITNVWGEGYRIV